MFNAPILSGNDVATLKQELQQALAAIAREQAQPSDYMALRTLYAAPGRIFEGMVILCDGTSFDPGSGAGVYVRRGGAWHLLG